MRVAPQSIRFSSLSPLLRTHYNCGIHTIRTLTTYNLNVPLKNLNVQTCALCSEYRAQLGSHCAGILSYPFHMEVNNGDEVICVMWHSNNLHDLLYSIINLLWSLMSKMSTTFQSVSYGPCSRTGVLPQISAG